MVVTLAVPARELWGLKNFITMRHLENMNKIILLTGTMVGYAYAMEFFIAWYSGALYEGFAFVNRAFGQHAWAYWIMISATWLAPQLFWFKKFRTSIPVMFLVVNCVNVGMWFERFVIIVLSLEQDFLPSRGPTSSRRGWTSGMLLGSFGLFFTLFLLFMRFLPVIAIAEIKAVMPRPIPRTVHGDHGRRRWRRTATPTTLIEEARP